MPGLKPSGTRFSFAMKYRIFNTSRILLAGLLFVMAPAMIRSQEAAKPHPVPSTTTAKPATSTPPKTYTLKVAREPILNISLKAEKSRLREVAADLSKRLRTPIVVSKALAQETISTGFSELTLEPAMQLLAPRVFIDYQIDMTPGSQPQALAIYLQTRDEEEPSTDKVVPAGSEAFVVEGDTEDGVESMTKETKKRLEAKPILVVFDRDGISVRSRQQPLSAVLLEIGGELGIPVTLESDGKEIVDLNTGKVSLEEALRRLSPNLRLYLRFDSQDFSKAPLRLVLKAIEPPKPIHQ